MTRPRADVRETYLLQQHAHMPLMIVDAEALGDDPLQITGDFDCYHSTVWPVAEAHWPKNPFRNGTAEGMVRIPPRTSESEQSRQRNPA